MYLPVGPVIRTVHIGIDGRSQHRVVKGRVKLHLFITIAALDFYP